MKKKINLPSLEQYIADQKKKKATKNLNGAPSNLDEMAQRKDAKVDLSPFHNGNDYAISTAARGNILEYAHPLDAKLIEKLNKPVVNAAIGKYVQVGFDANYGTVLATGVHINRSTYPELYEILAECAEILQIPVPYAVISNSVSGINACAAGTNQVSFIMISSILPMVMNRDELKFIIGHECGHLALGHVIYHTAGTLIGNASTLLPVVGKYLAQPIILPLKAWERRSEISADRAGLMCCGDIRVAQKALYKLQVGFLGSRDVNVDEYIRESEQILNSSVIGRYSELTMEHPLLPKRMKALGLFAHSLLYAKCAGVRPEPNWIDQNTLNSETSKILEIM